ncbi:hypothetical protein D4Q80_05060 [bacterium]|nr:MAG: hypothetical protein D4Q80_05060 [bacterium]
MIIIKLLMMVRFNTYKASYFKNRARLNKNMVEISFDKIYKIIKQDIIIEHFLAQDLSINNPGDNIINEIYASEGNKPKICAIKGMLRQCNALLTMLKPKQKLRKP